MPAVSVIVPAFNAAASIHNALASALGQSWGDLEVVVVDDASSDQTARVVEGWCTRDPRVRLVRADTNGGPARARNLAIEASAAPWLAPLDADDRFAPGRIERLLAVAEHTGADDLIADHLRLIDATSGRALGTALPEEKAQEAEAVSAEAFVRRNMFGRAGFDYGYLKPLIRRSVLERAGIRYREDLRIGEDYHLYLDCLLAGARMVVIAAPGYEYARAPGSISHRLSESALARLQAANRELLERSDLPLGLRAALDERDRLLGQMLGHVRFVDHIKGGRWAGAAALLARQPEVIPLVIRYGRESVLKRLGLMGLYGERI